MKTSEKKRLGNDLWSVPIGLRKSPQSFPPMQIPSNNLSLKTTSKNSIENKQQNICAKSALSVSFSPEAKQTIYNKNQTTTSRGLFSTRSLRLAASKIAEASPRLRRRNKSVSDASRLSTGWLQLLKYLEKKIKILRFIIFAFLFAFTSLTGFHKMFVIFSIN